MAGREAVDTCPRCQKCDRWRAAPEYIREPMLLWERFPCPPPGTDKAKLIVELDWTGRMGQRDGCTAFKRVVKRCHVDFKHVTLPDSLLNCDNSTLFVFGTQSVLAIILLCILFILVVILVFVCYRYGRCRCLRRSDKTPVTGVCTKVVSPDHGSLNTQLNRYYIHSQHLYRAGNIPERRGLPFEVRSNENGVEARLIKAIQSVPAQGYQFDDMCSQCRNSISRQSTLSSNRSRQGYERVYWREKDGLDRRVPSNDSLLYRRQSDRHRSMAGSSSDMSHYYEYIGEPPCDSSTNSYTGRRSNHSNSYFPRNSSSNFKDVPTSYGDTRCLDDERMMMLSRFINTEVDGRNDTDKEIVPHRSNILGRENTNSGRVRPYKEHFVSPPENGISLERSVRPFTCTRADSQINSPCSTQIFPDSNITRDNIRGYKYTYNPNFDDETTTTTTSRNDIGEVSSSPCTPSDCIDFDDTARENCDNNSSPNSIKLKVKNRTSSQRLNRTPDSDSSSICNNLTIPRTNSTFYKSRNK